MTANRASLMPTSDLGEPCHSIMNPHTAGKVLAQNIQDIVANELTWLAHNEYKQDIWEHMKQMEDEALPDECLIDTQHEIGWHMRPCLVDFIVEAHTSFALLAETLFLAINIFDRYCSRRVVYRQHYQLAGCTALLLAAKYADRKENIPQIQELIYLCCGIYDFSIFTQMELNILSTLEWKIGHPTTDAFLRFMAIEEHDQRDVRQMAVFISEIALYHRDFVSTKPSTVARSSLALARIVLCRPEADEGEWSPFEMRTLLRLSQYLNQPSPTLARKYSTSQMSRVSKLLSHFMAKENMLSGRNVNTSSQTTEVPMIQGGFHNTPLKGQDANAGQEGYFTPPSTPNDDSKKYYAMPSDHHLCSKVV